MYRQEHPNPQFERANWRNLNGTWQFEIDGGDSGEARGLARPDAVLGRQIEVPFCPESKLSGIGERDFMAAVWYKRDFSLSEKELEGRVVLHFGAVDYRATVWVNGTQVGTHSGGYASFCFDITPYVQAGDNTLTLRARDDTRSPLVPSGKQCTEYASAGCSYTRTTGIWQTVWLEFLPTVHIQKVKYLPQPEAGALTLTADLCGAGVFTAESFFDGKPTGSVSARSDGGSLTLTLHLTETHLWELGKGGLYDLRLTYGEDEVRSYFGLRSVCLDGYKFRLNGRSVFQRLVLDQGFYPDGIYTAPDDSELEADIDRSMACGFNGARLHQKVFEPRFLYHCDRKGYMVWEEFPSWGLDVSCPEVIYGLLPEWLEVMERDANHPAIVVWCPLNETWDFHGHRQFDPMLSLMYQATKTVDATRPCIDTSGAYHVRTDIFDLHDYEQDTAVYAARYADFAENGRLFDAYAARQTYTPGMPVVVSEYGGMSWGADASGWGYGDAPKTREAFMQRFAGLTQPLLRCGRVMGLCYTQLTNVEQEQNGLYTYDRKPKFDVAVLRDIMTEKAAIED